MLQIYEQDDLSKQYKEPGLSYNILKYLDTIQS